MLFQCERRALHERATDWSVRTHHNHMTGRGHDVMHMVSIGTRSVATSRGDYFSPAPQTFRFSCVDSSRSLRTRFFICIALFVFNK